MEQKLSAQLITRVYNPTPGTHVYLATGLQPQQP